MSATPGQGRENPASLQRKYTHMNASNLTAQPAQRALEMIQGGSASPHLAHFWSGMLYLQGNGILAIQCLLPDGQGWEGQAARAS